MEIKKGKTYKGYVKDIAFPDKGRVIIKGELLPDGSFVTAAGDEPVVMVRYALPGQTIDFRLTKKKGDRLEGLLLSVTQKAPFELSECCENAGKCGGCLYQGFPYDEILKIKERQINDLLKDYIKPETVYDGMFESPLKEGYRGKMEYTFGDEMQGGPLNLGLHKRGSFYDVLCADCCLIADEDYGSIVAFTRDYFREKGLPYYHRMRHTGLLRHLLVRKAVKTGEVLAALVTVSKDAYMGDIPYPDSDVFEGWCEGIKGLKYKGSLAGVLHILNDAPADAVKCDSLKVLYGRDHFYEELSGLRFKITPFSFFQANSCGAEVLYELICSYIREDCRGGKVFDLYSGTGTIAQMLAPAAEHVTGIELIEEAVASARENAGSNGLTNCDFIAGDVFKVLAQMDEKPDAIVVDPPRNGVESSALLKILKYGVKHIVYVSCKPSSFVRDMELIENCGYVIERYGMVDMFPYTGGTEVCALLKHL